MSPAKVWAFALYEIRRAVARKKVLALVVFTILITTVPYYLVKTSEANLLTNLEDPYVWVFGIFLPQGFFLPFTAILIAAGSMSEEYEQGTAEVLLSKPVSRDEFLAGKYLGGYMLLAMVILLNALLSLASATITFGEQLSIQVIPVVVLAQLFSSLVFYSIAFMSGELVRRSSLSYVLASATYFVSEVAGIYLRIIYQLTGNTFYEHINFYLPTTPGSSLPLLLAKPALPPAAGTLLQFLGIGATETSVTMSVGLIVIYVLAAVVLTRTHFVTADVSKKVS